MKHDEQINTREQPLPKDVCDEIAKKVAGLLQQEGARDYFSNQIADLCMMAERCAEHVQKCLNDSALIISPQLYEQEVRLREDTNALWNDPQKDGREWMIVVKNAQMEALRLKRNTPPEPGCEYVSFTLEAGKWLYYNLNDIENWPYIPPRWMRPGPANPVTWFGLFATWDTPNLTVDERRMHDCFLLAAIHDNEFHTSTSRLYDSHELIFSQGYQGRFKRDEFATALWHHYSSFDNKSDYRSRALQKAFDRVESYLAELPKSQDSPSLTATPLNSGTGKEDKDEADNQCGHAPDYGWAIWYGHHYDFKTKNRRTAIKLLWEAHENPNKVGVDERTIGAAVETSSKNYRLSETFRHRHAGQKKTYHPAWGNMIEHLGNGVYRLRIPKQAESSIS